jgi:pimeloyl-ACP methyl ester carboxylesterase
MSARQGEVVVFIHGMRSSPSVFDAMIDRLEGNGTLGADSRSSQPYPYEWWHAIDDNATKFAQFLRSVGRCQIVAHSMGGLVARLAILTAHPPLQVRRLIMLATPNAGALTTAQFGLLAQPIARLSAGLLIGQYLRSPGVRDLTRVYDVFRPHLRSPNADGVEYVTIPGLYFHGDRPNFKDRGAQDNAEIRLFRRFVIAQQLATAVSSMVRIDIQRPHDGIVEERSCSMGTPGQLSEKNPSLNESDRDKKTYAHLHTDEALDLTHTALVSDQRIIDLVASLIEAKTLALWRKKVPRTLRIKD